MNSWMAINWDFWMKEGPAACHKAECGPVGVPCNTLVVLCIQKPFTSGSGIDFSWESVRGQSAVSVHGSWQMHPKQKRSLGSLYHTRDDTVLIHTGAPRCYHNTSKNNWLKQIAEQLEAQVKDTRHPCPSNFPFAHNANVSSDYLTVPVACSSLVGKALTVMNSGLTWAELTWEGRFQTPGSCL